MRGLLVKIVIIFFEVTSAAPQCDMMTNIELDEGNMGQSSDFNWLGILKVFLSDSDPMQVAVTGIVLVKANRALANADVIVQIPKRIFQHDTHAMFITDGDVIVNYSLVSYVTHPEYRAETFCSIAIILLNVDDDSPLVPICFPIVSFDTSYLYLTGFTDENEILEKMIYRIQYQDRSECEEFYEEEGLVVENRQPISYLCGKRQSSRKRCVWDDGMALVSNSSGWFTLIGFSIYGPGCAAPARFISILHYSAWIQEVTRDSADAHNYSLDLGFIPIHRTFTALRDNGKSGSYELNLARGETGTNRAKNDQLEETDRSPGARRVWNQYDYFKWPFPIETLEHFKLIPDMKNRISIMPFNNTHEQFEGACSDQWNELVYAEDFKLNAPRNTFGTVEYKISLYDLFLNKITCVMLSVECTNRTEAFLEFGEHFAYTAMFESETPEEVLQVKVVTERGENFTKIEQSPFLKPNFIKSGRPYEGPQENYELSIRFTFKTKALMNFKMFSNARKPIEIKRRVLKKKNKFPTNKMSYWGSAQPVNSVKAAALVLDREVVLDTVSEARRSDVTPGAVIIGCLLITACSTRKS